MGSLEIIGVIAGIVAGAGLACMLIIILSEIFAAVIGSDDNDDHWFS